MKIIFLDFDGVINSESWMVSRWEEFDDETIHRNYPLYEFSPELVSNLNEIIDKTDAKIVVSSTWRKRRTIQELQGILSMIGVKGEVIDKTSVLGSIDGYTIPRGCEIQKWLKQEGKFQRINWSADEQRKHMESAIVKSYVILDDDSDMLFTQSEHFVQTSWKSGLEKHLVEKAIKILNTPLDKLYYNNSKN